MNELIGSSEPFPEESRNSQLAEMVARGITPVLPFEMDVLRAEFAGLVARQDENGKLLGEAMSQSAETWHDNAAADVISIGAMSLVKRAESVADHLKTSAVVGYPGVEIDEVTLGSLVEVRFEGDDTPESMYITSISTRIPGEYVQVLPEGCQVVTMLSPFGAALVNERAGAYITYDVDGNSVGVRILSVSQPPFDNATAALAR